MVQSGNDRKERVVVFEFLQMDAALYELLETVCTAVEIGFLEHFVNHPEHFLVDEAFQTAHFFYVGRVFLAADSVKNVVDVIGRKYVAEDVVVANRQLKSELVRRQVEERYVRFFYQFWG